VAQWHNIQYTYTAVVQTICSVNYRLLCTHIDCAAQLFAAERDTRTCEPKRVSVCVCCVCVQCCTLLYTTVLYVVCIPGGWEARGTCMQPPGCSDVQQQQPPLIAKNGRRTRAACFEPSRTSPASTPPPPAPIPAALSHCHSHIPTFPQSHNPTLPRPPHPSVTAAKDVVCKSPVHGQCRIRRLSLVHLFGNLPLP
jgi:hypothetical protein